MKVLLNPEAERDLAKLPAQEKVAVDHALEKLKAMGDRLRYPHSSNVEGADRLRELRPRGGRSPSRAFYRRVGNAMVIGSVGPEAESNPRGFQRAIRAAEKRLAQLEE